MAGEYLLLKILTQNEKTCYIAVDLKETKFHPQIQCKVQHSFPKTEGTFMSDFHHQQKKGCMFLIIE